jgi:hypothetical protein
MSFPFTDLPGINKIIDKAAEHGIRLTPSDFTENDELGLCLDGMPADQWLDAMTME